MAEGRCALCQKVQQLRKSHAIPDAFFKQILRENSGKAIALSSSPDEVIGYTCDSWWDYLLCGDCEAILNDRYDRYGISVLRGATGNSHKHDDGITLSEIDFEKWQLFSISIFWRAAVSRHHAYSTTLLPRPYQTKFREAIYNSTRIAVSVATIKLALLVDPTPEGFSPEALRDWVLSPFLRRVPNRLSLNLVAQGFLVELLIPGLKFKERSAKGIINPDNKILFIPHLNIFDDQSLVRFMASNYGKQAEGKSRLGKQTE